MTAGGTDSIPTQAHVDNVDLDMADAGNYDVLGDCKGDLHHIHTYMNANADYDNDARTRDHNGNSAVMIVVVCGNDDGDS